MKAVEDGGMVATPEIVALRHDLKSAMGLPSLVSRTPGILVDVVTKPPGA